MAGAWLTTECLQTVCYNPPNSLAWAAPLAAYSTRAGCTFRVMTHQQVASVSIAVSVPASAAAVIPADDSLSVWELIVVASWRRLAAAPSNLWDKRLLRLAGKQYTGMWMRSFPRCAYLFRATAAACPAALEGQWP